MYKLIYLHIICVFVYDVCAKFSTVYVVIIDSGEYCIVWFLCFSADVASSKTSSVSTNVIVGNDGNVTWLSSVIYRSSCTIAVR